MNAFRLLLLLNELRSQLTLSEGCRIQKIKKQEAEGEIRTRVVASTVPI